MSKRLKLKRAVTLPSTAIATGGTHDRRSTDLVVNAKVGTVIVDDPYEAGAKITVFRSLRHDPLAGLHGLKLNPINEAQYHAGRHWQRNRELTEIGGAKAIDFTREAVDGAGGIPGEAKINDDQIRAFKQMTLAMRALGMEGGALMRWFLDDCLTIADIAVKWGMTKERERAYIGMRIRECLTTLAICFGYQMGTTAAADSRLVIRGCR
jgi:hypothetical protein